MSASVLHGLIAAITAHAEAHAGAAPTVIKTSPVVRDFLADDINAQRFRADPAAKQISPLTDEVRVIGILVQADDSTPPWRFE